MNYYLKPLLVVLWLVGLYSTSKAQTTYQTVGIIGSATSQGWGASTPMTQDATNPHLWRLDNVALVAGEAKFRANDAWDVNWGATDFPRGTATLNGANIAITAGTYNIVFNDESGQYSFNDTSIPTYNSVGVIGSATPQGWNASTPMTQDVFNPHLWTLNEVTLVAGEAKFRANDEWTVNWGAIDFPNGTGVQNGANIPVTAGKYTITFNDETGAYSFIADATPPSPIYTTVGIIGSATAQGWNASTPMVQDATNPHLWKLENVALVAGELKFRADNAWDVNWGAADFPSGTGVLNGANIPVTAGQYNVTFNDESGAYNFETVVVNTDPAVTLVPAFPKADDSVTIIYDATQGNAGLVGATKVYMHSGIVTNGVDGRTWTNVVGNYGQDDGIGEMTKVAGETDKWQITLSPSIRSYYSATANDLVFRLGMIFRNADGSKTGKTTDDSDFFLNINPGDYARVSAPATEGVFAVAGDKITFAAEASSVATVLNLYLDGALVATVNNTDKISYEATASTSKTYTVKVEGTVNGTAVSNEKTVQLTLRQANTVEALPAGLVDGINYSSDASKVTLVLTAPRKQFVYVVGDFNNWAISDSYQMKQTPDGEKFWLEINNLTAGKEYIYQYWVEGTLKIGDPYADKVIDPANDGGISAATYPNLIQHPQPQHGISTVLQTGQTPYQWTYPEPVGGHPANENLVIYELLIRDFVGAHNYKAVIDSLDYLQRLGVNAIELMPINEFENNDSWGYNPSYMFAPDKYYGTKNDLKQFIEACHARGMVVLLDIVWNHNYGQSPLVQMYFDKNTGKVTSDSPWFNVDSPNNVFSFGYDFNHESQYTKDLMDRGNLYWLKEYKFDGFRFDFTKGLTNTPGDGGAYDAARIAILKRMNTVIKQADPNAYVILEHFADNQEEKELSDDGMMIWGNLNFSYRQVAEGRSSDLGWGLASARGWSNKNLIAYMESHDEERMMYSAKTFGAASGDYDTKDTKIALERVKLASAFYYTVPGPKMIWQFGELGYDISINFNGRVGRKPLPWGTDGLGYYQDADRQRLYKAKAAIINLVQNNANVFENGNFSWTPNGDLRKINISHQDMNVTIIGNFGMSNGTITPDFQHTGTWYNFFAGSAYEVSSTTAGISLAPGEFHIFTDKPVNFPEAGLVTVFEPTVTVAPATFKATDRIKLIFNAQAADPAGTAGLVGADKVYLYSGVVTEGADGTTWQHIKGSTNQDDGIGEMTRVPGEKDKWVITFRPSDYYQVPEGETMHRLAMYFRDANGNNIGKGRGGKDIFLDVQPSQQVVKVYPGKFNADEQIRIVFDATEADAGGGTGLVGAAKVYMHSGVVIRNTNSPNGGDWSNVVGNYGQDDGIGEMTKVAGETDKWEITITPRTYYNLPDSVDVYYLSMVFRNADGTAEGKGPDGTDIFIRTSQGAPAAPTNLRAQVRRSKVHLSWTDNATGEAGYLVQRKTNNGTYSDLAVLDADATCFTDENVKRRNTYTYRVQALSVSEEDSPFSNEVRACTGRGFKAFVVFPNPARRYVNILLRGHADVALQATLKDRAGNQCTLTKVRQGYGGRLHRFRLPRVRRGWYFLKVSSPNGVYRTTKLFVR
jgi:1,4-alpha-glucan branching enzyme